MSNCIKISYKLKSEEKVIEETFPLPWTSQRERFAIGQSTISEKLRFGYLCVEVEKNKRIYKSTSDIEYIIIEDVL